MKKSFMILAVLAMSALAMVSCKKDKDTDNGEKITIYATMDSPTTGGERTHLGPTTNNFTPTYWSTNDDVAVFSGNQKKEFTLTGGENTSDATFAGEAPASNSAYCAFYPYYPAEDRLSATQSGSTYTVTYGLPYCQTYKYPVNGNPTFNDMFCPMIAYSTDGQNYQFKNMMGVLKLDLKGTGTVSYIVLKDNNTSAKLHGTATVSVSTLGATPSLTSECITGGGNELMLTCGSGVELNENTATSFYFVVPVGTLGTNGFIIDVYNANDEYYRIDKSNISGNIIQRAIISTLAVEDVEVPATEYKGLCFTAEEANSTVMMMLVNHGDVPDYELYYSYNGTDWNEFAVYSMHGGEEGTTITLSNVGDKVYFSGNNPFGFSSADYESGEVYLFNFYMTGKIAASGNVMSLLKRDCSVKEIPNDGCFQKLFDHCSSLTAAPELPATTLTNNCYESMFADCSSLVEAPELPATNLKESCYNTMFSFCTSLVKAPELPATTLKESCYAYMLQYCYNLANAPELPATELAPNCYFCMFDYDNKIESIKVHFSEWLDDETNYWHATKFWLEGVASNGTFYCPSALPDKPGVHGIPEGWTRVNID